MSELNRRSVYESSKFAIDKKYHVDQILGKGTYGVVCKAIEIGSHQSRPIAIKKVQKIFNNEILVKRAFRELRLMRQFRGHKNIISLLDLDMISTQPYDGLYCYQELMDHDLSRVISGPVQLSEMHVQSFVYQLLCGLKYIHSADVIHRDLKPGNLLVNSLGQLKICDFGLARGVARIPNGYHNQRLRYTKYVATRWYRAPELILQIKNYTKAIDLWSVGCILCELIGRKAIFKGSDQINQLIQIVGVLGLPKRELILEMSTEHVWQSLVWCREQAKKSSLRDLYPKASKLALDLIHHLLDYDITTRYTARQALEHGYLSNFHNPEEEPSCESIVDFSFEALNGHDLEFALYDEIRSFRHEVRHGPRTRRPTGIQQYPVFPRD